jgi:glycosyltransferase involved in cell wall biosynthesis
VNWIPESNRLIGSSQLNFKGTDVLIKGLGAFTRRFPAAGWELLLPRKGKDVAATDQLIAAEGIGGRIRWFDEMTQGEVLEEYARADIVVDQLANSVVGMGGLDAMATGRPLLANGRPEIMEPFLGTPSPICQAASPDEVCSQMQRLVSNRTERWRVGVASRAFVERHFTSDAQARVLVSRLGPQVASPS